MAYTRELRLIAALQGPEYFIPEIHDVSASLGLLTMGEIYQESVRLNLREWIQVATICRAMSTVRNLDVGQVESQLRYGLAVDALVVLQTRLWDHGDASLIFGRCLRYYGST